MGYVCNFLIRSLGILVEIIVLSDRKKTNNSVQMTKLQRLIKTYLHYVGDSDLITNKFLLIDTLVHTNVKKYIKRQENQTNSPALGYSHFFLIYSIQSQSTHTLFIEYLLEHYCILILPTEQFVMYSPMHRPFRITVRFFLPFFSFRWSVWMSFNKTLFYVVNN